MGLALSFHEARASSTRTRQTVTRAIIQVLREPLYRCRMTMITRDFTTRLSASSARSSPEDGERLLPRSAIRLISYSGSITRHLEFVSTATRLKNPERLGFGCCLTRMIVKIFKDSAVVQRSSPGLTQTNNRENKSAHPTAGNVPV